MEEKEDILLVDDNVENLKVLANFLKPEGYRIRVAKNGIQALKSIEKKAPRIVLLDIQMPEMGGFETCRRLKDDEKTVGIPIIFISALSETLDKVKAFKLGAIDYIEKPFQMEEVLARVSNHLTMVRQRDQLEEALKKVKFAQNKLIQSEKMISLGVLSAGIAHEINNPINFVSAGAAGIELDMLDLVKVLDFYDNLDFTNCLPKEVEQIKKLKVELDYQYIKENVMATIKDIKMGAERTAEIVKGLKRFSRIDSEERFEVNIQDELESNIKIINRLSKKEIHFIREFDESAKFVFGFPGQLNQLFMNLIMNAEQAIENEGTIKIITRNNKRGVNISISDSGCGIPEEIGDRIFDPFLTTKEVGEGTGLGLSISFGIVKNHSGEITYSSEINKGTTFNIYLPYKN